MLGRFVMRPVSGLAVCQVHVDVSIYFSAIPGLGGHMGRKDSQKRDVLEAGWSMAQEDAGPGFVLRTGGYTQRLEPGAGFSAFATPWAG